MNLTGTEFGLWVAGATTLLTTLAKFGAPFLKGLVSTTESRRLGTESALAAQDRIIADLRDQLAKTRSDYTEDYRQARADGQADMKECEKEREEARQAQYLAESTLVRAGWRRVGDTWTINGGPKP